MRRIARRDPARPERDEVQQLRIRPRPPVPEEGEGPRRSRRRPIHRVRDEEDVAVRLPRLIDPDRE